METPKENNKTEYPPQTLNQCVVCGHKTTLGHDSSKHAVMCPVCHGSGRVDAGFYTRTGTEWMSSGGTEKCQSCDGKGHIVI